MTALWRPEPGPVTCIGETMAALVPEPVVPLETADLLRVDVAGAESNVARYLADHRVPARWVSAVGDDPWGRLVRTRVAESGVDTSAVRTDPQRPTGVLFKNPEAYGTRVQYYRQRSAASALAPELLGDPAVTSAALVHLTGITAALSPSCRALVTEALRLHVGGRPYVVSFDVNHRAALWSDGSAATVLARFADRADITFVGLDEAQALWGNHLVNAAAVRRMLPGPRILVVKDGDREATAFTGAEQCAVPAPHVRVVEPIGAGDAFAAGFLAALLRGDDTVRALRLGHLTAASALRVGGDHGPLPPRSQIEELLAASDAQWAMHGAGAGTKGATRAGDP
ncbi:sugar kinase [Streptomyces sp. NPDC059720]|uniref:sugar kinase n=1 Tax=Streptomyces sp. NPDC059720 TaxID=3346924 RepID=UPI0036869ECC